MFRRFHASSSTVRFLRSESANSLAEYAVLLGCVAAVAVIALTFLGKDVRKPFQRASRPLAVHKVATRSGQPKPVAAVAETETEHGEGGGKRFVVVAAFSLLGLALIACQWLIVRFRRPRKKPRSEDVADHEDNREERMYRRRQEILRRISNNTAQLFRCHLRVCDVMSEDVVKVRPGAKLGEIATRMAKERLPHVYVCDQNDRLLGIIREQDSGNWPTRAIHDVMDLNLVTVDHNAPLTQAITVILKHDQSVLPVVDDGRLRGEVLLTDLAITTQCILQIILRVGQMVQSAPAADADVVERIRTMIGEQRSKAADLNKMIRKLKADAGRAKWQPLCDEMSGLVDLNRELSYEIEAVVREVDERMQSLVTLFETRTDELTGFGNQRALRETLTSQCAINKRYDHPASLMLVQFNSAVTRGSESDIEAYGERLRRWATWLHERVRETDLVARYVDETFAVVMPYSDHESACLLQSRLEHALSNHDESATMMAGISTIVNDDTVDDLISRAERALQVSDHTRRPADELSAGFAPAEG